MIWKRSDSYDNITDRLTPKTFTDTSVTYSLAMKAGDDIDGQAFVCETTNSATDQYGCNSGRVTVIGVAESNSALVAFCTVLGISLALCGVGLITIYTRWTNSRIKKRKGRCTEIPTADSVDPSEQSEISRLHCNELREAAGELHVERLERENKRLSSKVYEYEERLYRPTGGIQYKSQPELVHATSVQRSKNSIKGITVLIDELFAIFETSPNIVIYDSMTFEQSKNPLQVDGLWNPEDIASCSTNNCLYVIAELKDAPESDFLKIDPKGIQPMERWRHIDCYRGRLSVYEANIMVCLTEKRVVMQYSPNGETLRTIGLSSQEGFDELWCVLQVAEAYFVVSNYNKTDRRQSLCLVDYDGKIIPPVNNDEMLKTAICLVNDSDKSVLVLLKDGKKTISSLGEKKDFVLLLNHKLQRQKTLIEHSCNEYGVKMCLDRTGSRLFVAVNRPISNTDNLILYSGRILCYNIK